MISLGQIDTTLLKNVNSKRWISLPTRLWQEGISFYPIPWKPNLTLRFHALKFCSISNGIIIPTCIGGAGASIMSSGLTRSRVNRGRACWLDVDLKSAHSTVRLMRVLLALLVVNAWFHNYLTFKMCRIWILAYLREAGCSLSSFVCSLPGGRAACGGKTFSAFVCSKCHRCTVQYTIKVAGIGLVLFAF